MCGIFGSTRYVDDNLLSNVMALLDHRGPDSNGFERIAASTQSHPITFVHTRLAIQDLSASGHQPMASKDQRWWITFNGEIYNHFELRKKLSSTFRGTSDTETLLEYIAAFGIDQALNDINGMYAFAIFDSLENLIYIARDPFGIKPIYFSAAGSTLTFASELKPVLASRQENETTLNKNALECFLNLRYVPSPDTLVNGVSRLQPGHLATFDLAENKLDVRPFVKPSFTRFQGSFKDAVQGYRTELSQAVKQQLISDVPVGILLSAGIDSAVIAAFAREHSSDITSHTVGFGSQHEECEIDGAAETARILGIRHEATTVDPTKLIDSLEDIVRSVEEPLGTTSIMPMWYLTELAKKSATVVLSGQGNDEPWGGYRRYQIELVLKMLPMLKSKPFSGAGKLSSLTRNDAIRRGLACLGQPDDSARFAKAYALFTPKELNLLGVSSGPQTGSINYWLDLLANNADIEPAERMMRIDSRMNLADDLLLYSDKVSMNYALEVRVPMLDPNVVQFVENLPLRYKASLRRTKIAHREMAKDFLPREIIERPKQGFQVPFGLWCKTTWKDYMEAHLLAPNLTINSTLDSQGIQTIWQRHLSGQRDYSRQLFALLTLSLWMENYL
ncbi:MAG: asparagine synthase (glutamine-hydrolyzing) [Candidatus Azotimanducaceae bacterium]|jgi:asparagine synthase (glutamine-hydrolysing)